MSPSPVALTADEVADVCRPLRQPAAQARYLQGLGVHTARRPDGTVLVDRQHYLAVRGHDRAVVERNDLTRYVKTK